MTQTLSAQVAEMLPEWPYEWCEFAGSPVFIESPWDLPHRPEDVAPLLAVKDDGREIRFRFIRKDPQRNRRVVMLLHGMGITAASFAGIAPHLFATHDLLIVDYNSFASATGFGPGGVTLNLLARGAWRVADVLALNYVTILGSSLGGALALIMTGMHPEKVDRLVLINAACYPQKLPLMYRIIRMPILGELFMLTTPPRRFVDGVAWLGYTDPKNMPPRIYRSYLKNMRRRKNRMKLMDVMRALPGHSGEMQSQVDGFSRMTQPALIIWGAQEKLLPVNSAARLHRQMPHSQLAEFPDLAHLPHEESPQRVGPVIAEFLSLT